MKKKVLFVATVVKTHIMVFHLPYLKWLKDCGYEVHVSARNDYEIKSDCKIPYCDKYYDFPFERSPINLNNIRTYAKLKKIIDENEYDLVHCHTPMGGVITRFATRKARKKNTKVIYTAHGFHFYKGAPLKNWLIYYPVEKFLANFTDVLITINNEDYQHAVNNNFKSKRIEYINGVGIDLDSYKKRKNVKKEELGYTKKDFIITYVAELSHRKNQIFLFEAIQLLRNEIPDLKVLLIGTGPLESFYKNKVKELGIKKYVHFLGYRNDVPEILSMSDLAVSTAKQEGLPVNIMESMATGLPLIVTNCRGNRDLVKNNQNGYVIELDDSKKFAQTIIKLYESKEIREKFKKENLNLVSKYSINNVLNEMKEIYDSQIQ